MLLAREAIDRSLRVVDHLRLVQNHNDLNKLWGQLKEKQERPTIVSWLNANALNVAQKNPELAKNLYRSSLLLRDGVGVSILLRAMGRNAGINMNGTDCIPKILALHAGKPVALLGTEEPYLSKATEAAEKLGCNVVLKMDGFQTPEAYLAALVKTPVDVVVLGMGVPKQEQIAMFLSKNLSESTLILNGGAILDFMAQRFPRAPKAWRKLRMEWVFRLIQEPKRLWRRYILGGLYFVSSTAQLAIATKLGRKASREAELRVVPGSHGQSKQGQGQYGDSSSYPAIQALRRRA